MVRLGPATPGFVARRWSLVTGDNNLGEMKNTGTFFDQTLLYYGKSGDWDGGGIKVRHSFGINLINGMGLSKSAEN